MQKIKARVSSRQLCFSAPRCNAALCIATTVPPTDNAYLPFLLCTRLCKAVGRQCIDVRFSAKAQKGVEKTAADVRPGDSDGTGIATTAVLHLPFYLLPTCVESFHRLGQLA